MPRTSQIRVVKIKAETSGVKELGRFSEKMSRLNRTTKRMESGFGRLRNTFRGFIAAVGVREVARAADTFQLLEDRIKVFTGDSESAAAAMKDLQEAAKFTRTSVSALATSYTRIALATQELGLSQDQILASTVALQQTFRISGATIAEATASTIQMSQGLASGQLRGQELRSVLEANTVFAGLLAEELNTTRGNLIKFAEAGTITSDVVLNTLKKNFDSLNKSTEKLGITFEQAFTIVLDAARVKLAEFNKKLKISDKFAKAMFFLIDNFEKLLAILAVFTASRVIISIGAQLATLGKVMKTLSLGAKFNFIAAGITAVYVAGKKLDKYLESRAEKVPIAEKIAGKERDIKLAVKRIKLLRRTMESSITSIGRKADELLIESKGMQLARLAKELDDLRKLQAKGLKFVPKKETEEELSLVDRLSGAIKKMLSTSTKLEKVIKPGPYKALNDQLRNNVITLEEYGAAIKSMEFEKLNENFKQGKITVDQLADSMNKLAMASKDLPALSQIGLGIRDGAKSYVDQVGTLSQEMSKAVTATFQRLENSIFDFIKTGKFAFREFTQAILDDLTKIAIRRAIVLPLANAAFGPTKSANGNVFQGGNLVPFATGGILSGPTMFPLNGGKTGLAGEAGPEGILPLSRGKSGRLGVDASGMGVTVNIINNASETEVETEESTGPGGEKQLDVFIVDKVGQAFGQGKFDRTFKELYGVNRRGR